MKLVVDGVIFQRGATGIARMWSEILTELKRYADLGLVLLDRGNGPSFDGIERIEFPSYKWNSNTASDSLLLERICREIGAEIFSSTFHTTPMTIPSVLVLYDATPDVLDFELSPRQNQERQIAINFASYYACVSERARAELGLHYRGAFERSVVAARGAERAAQSSSRDWEGMADCLYQLFRRAHAENASAARQEFVREWERLRTIQAAVDPCRPSEL
jgi:hypothetical protein